MLEYQRKIGYNIAALKMMKRELDLNIDFQDDSLTNDDNVHQYDEIKGSSHYQNGDGKKNGKRKRDKKRIVMVS